MSESQASIHDAKAHEPEIACRLCDGKAILAWAGEILGRYHVGYYRCSECESLMTEKPTWIEKAYADQARLTDLAAAGRVERCRVLIFWLWKLFGLRGGGRLLDWGGGDGLLVRKLRDDGINAYLYDIYTKNNYANGFEGNPDEHYNMVTAFEVWEHLTEPAADLQPMFAHQPDLLLITTEFYKGQGKTWPYLATWSGRHVFFWSTKALRKVGEWFGYRVVVGTNIALFYRPQGVSRSRQQMLRPWLALRGTRIKHLLWVLWPKRSLQAEDKATLDQYVTTIAADA